MISLILTLALIGFLAYLIVTYIPMPDVLKKAIVVIIVVFVVLWLLQILGVGDMPIPHLR